MSTAHRVDRWRREARVDGITAVLLAAFAVLRLVATIRRPIALFNDSASYFELGLWGNVRFPVVTTLYAAVGDHRAIVTLQVLIGIVCWSVAAVVAGSVLVPRVVREGFRALVLLLGLTIPVARFDNALLSESIAISLTVVVVACALRCVCLPTRNAAIAVFVVATVWAFVRQNNVLVLGVATVVIAAFGLARPARRYAWRLALGFLAVACVGIVLASSTSQIQEYNTASVLVRRVFTDPDRQRWFEDHGMPTNGAQLLLPPYRNAFDDPAVELQVDERFGAWLVDDGAPTYARYLLSHPRFLLTTPFGSDGAFRALASGAGRYGFSRRVLPSGVEDAVWPRSDGTQTAVLVVALVVVAAAVVRAVRSRTRRRALAAAGAVLVIGLANVVIVTHSAGWEYERLLVPTGVAARMALVFLLAAVVGDVRVGAVSEPAATAARDRAPDRPGAARSGRALDRGPGSATDRGAGDSFEGVAADPAAGSPGTS